MSFIQNIRCDGGCKRTLPYSEEQDVPEGWRSVSKGRLHICPECDGYRKAMDAWQSARDSKRREVYQAAWQRAEAEQAAELAKWDKANPKPAQIEVARE